MCIHRCLRTVIGLCSRRSTDRSIPPYINVSIHRFVYLFIYRSIHLSIYIYISIHRSIHLSLLIYRSIIHRSIGRSLHLQTHTHIYIYISTDQSIHQSIHLSMYIYTCMYVWIVYSPWLLDVLDLIGYTHTHTYVLICTQMHACTHMHRGHIEVLLNPNFKFTISTSVKPAAANGPFVLSVHTPSWVESTAKPAS